VTALDPRTPVLVGAGVVQQREDDFDEALEPAELMIAALERAAEDAGARALLARADSIRAPRGLWDYADPCRIVAERLGATGARTEVSEVGVLQTTLFGRAAQDIARGRADVVLLTGGEARYRAKRAAAAGREEGLARQPAGVEPDSVLRPSGMIVSELEIRAHLTFPVRGFAMIENALRAAEGVPLDVHRREVAELWAAMSRVAAVNPHAWSPNPVSAEEIREARDRNPMLAFPYTKLHVSQWNVDQAAGLVLCSLETARALGIPRKRWVFPLAVADSNHMLPLPQRRALHRSPGFARAGERALARARCEVADLAHLELYSCFPVAVRVQTRELGIPEGRRPTVTGGMAFAGGPLNNFVLQAQARMTHVLRGDPGSVGLVTAVSGILTKQGVSLWSTEPRGQGFRFDDVSAETAADVEPVQVVAEARGTAHIASYTVLCEGEKPSQSILLCDLEDDRRALVASQDEDLARSLLREEACGRRVRLSPGGDVALA
jgi:acetyl-CoA C-acetyltransferase